LSAAQLTTERHATARDAWLAEADAWRERLTAETDARGGTEAATGPGRDGAEARIPGR
jgi:hypothetical protein